MTSEAHFEVREIFRSLHGPSIVFAGRIVDGTVRAGMEIALELQPRLSCSCTIRSVEYIERVSVGEALVGLHCAETRPGEAELYSELCPPGTVVQVSGKRGRMNKYLRDLQVLAGISSGVLASVLVLALRSLTRETTVLSLVLCAFLATLLALSTWFAVRAQSAEARVNMRAACRGGLILGGVAFAIGYIGPVVITPEANQGPLIGIFFTGPLGFVVGVAGALGWRLWRQIRRGSAASRRE